MRAQVWEARVSRRMGIDETLALVPRVLSGIWNRGAGVILFSSPLPQSK